MNQRAIGAAAFRVYGLRLPATPRGLFGKPVPRGAAVLGHAIEEAPVVAGEDV